MILLCMLHLDVIRSKIEKVKTEITLCMAISAIMQIYTQYYCTV